MSDEITLQEGNFVTWRRIKNSGLDVSQGQKWPCQHLNHFFNEFTARKKYRVYLHEILWEKMFCAKKVTKLPDLTVGKYLYDKRRISCMITGRKYSVHCDCTVYSYSVPTCRTTSSSWGCQLQKNNIEEQLMEDKVKNLLYDYFSK